jgi:urease beta subunit
MRLIPWEEERLQVFAAAELARGGGLPGFASTTRRGPDLRRDARGGAGRVDVTESAAGRAAVGREVLDGVRELLDEVRLEVLLGDGARVIALVDPLDRGTPPDPLGPGALLIGDRADIELNGGRETIELTVTSRSRRLVRVSSHYPFERANARLEFDRAAARGFRLDIAAGSYVGWAPGESKTVRLVRYAGVSGGNR